MIRIATGPVPTNPVWAPILNLLVYVFAFRQAISYNKADRAGGTSDFPQPVFH